MANANTTIQVSTIRHTVIAAGMVEVFTGSRLTDKMKKAGIKEIPADQRTRAILVPELTIPDVPTKFQSFMLDQLYAMAKAQLADLWEEAGAEGLRTVPADIWTVEPLLAYAARKSETQKLSAELVKQAAQPLLDAVVPKDKHDAVREALVNFAAPNPSVLINRSTALRDWIAKYKKDNEPSWVLVSLERRILKRIEELTASTDAF